MLINQFTANKVSEYIVPEIEINAFSYVKNIVENNSYLDFMMNISNGGFFFDRSFQIYSIDKMCIMNIFDVNNKINTAYGELTNGLFFIAQDVFGNQFGFKNGEFIFFNIETAETSILANDFIEMLSVILEDVDFYTGNGFLKWYEMFYKEKIEYNQRICPKIPFVLGGEYESQNFHIQSYPNYIFLNANIAKQIFDLPDGLDVRLIVK